MPTQLQRRTETQGAILDSILGMYLDGEGAESSLSAVAERAGVAKSTVLYHFHSRLGLLEALADRLWREMGQRLSPIDQFPDPRAFVGAFLRQGREPTVRVFWEVGDQLMYASRGRGVGRGLQAMVDALEHLGVTERRTAIAAAALHMGREITFRHYDDSAIEAILDELFVDSSHPCPPVR